MNTLLQPDSPDLHGLRGMVHEFNTGHSCIHTVRYWCQHTFGDRKGWDLTYHFVSDTTNKYHFSGKVAIRIYDNHPWPLDRILVMLALSWS